MKMKLSVISAAILSSSLLLAPAVSMAKLPVAVMVNSYQPLHQC